MLSSNNKNHVRRISVYVKAGCKAATTYYRFYQYFVEIDAHFNYHLMIPNKRLAAFFPIDLQPLWKKIVIFFYIYFRVLWNLIKDVVKVPDDIVISRCLINRVMPYSYRLLLMVAKRRGVRIIYDFDDQILFLREVTHDGFNFLTGVSDVIIVGNPLLKDLICKRDKSKVIFLPTTDGEMYEKLTKGVIENRLSLFDSEIRIVWVGTYSGLVHIKEIIASIEFLGEYLNKDGRNVVFTVVCDLPFEYQPANFTLVNVNWTRQAAIEAILGAHVGIMPLKDTIGTKGKCSFKLIQYMSAGLPVIGTAVGMNKMVLNDTFGRGTETNETRIWIVAFLDIIGDKDVWKKMSEKARIDWEDNFSVDRNQKEWLTLL